MLEGLLKFPCTFQKRPLTQWNRTARQDADIKGWQLVGVPTGSVSGFDVLDVDVAGLGWLDSVWDRLPPTRAHATRSGGRHFFFRHVDGLRNSVSRIADGVDVRADGGFVIWWPRQGLRVLSDAEIAQWPAWLLELARGSVQVAAGMVVRIGWMWAWASAHMRPLALQSELNPRSIFAHVAKSSSAKSSRLRSENEIDCFTGLHADLAK